MNKKLLTMAVGAALAMSAVAAQAEVTVYGQLQVEHALKFDVDYKNDVNTLTDKNQSEEDSAARTVDNRRGRLGIKASEDLGGGMTALAHAEWQSETTTGTAYLQDRFTYVGLKGAFGTITAGALKSPYKYTGGVNYDPFVTTTLQARSNGGMLGGGIESLGGFAANNAFGAHGFIENSIGYSNKFGPVKLAATYSLDEEGTVNGADGDYTFALSVGQGPWEAFVAATHDDELLANVVAGVSEDRATYDATKVGGKFKIGGGNMSHTIKVVAEQFSLEEDGMYSTDVTTIAYDTKIADYVAETTGTLTFVGYELGLGKTTIVVQVGAEEHEFDTGLPVGIKPERTRDYTAVGVIHKLSKKTRVFAGIRSTAIEEDDKLAATLDYEEDVDVASIGLRVDF